MLYSSQIAPEQIETLRDLLGRYVVTLYAPSLDVRRYWAAAPSLSILVAGGWIVIESDWRETPKEGIDYHLMQIGRADHPKGVPKTFDDRGRKLLGPPVCSVQIGIEKSEVTRVVILDRSERGKSEQVCYDAALRFDLANGHSFAVAVQRSIAGGVEVSTDERGLEWFSSEYALRLEIVA